MWDGSLEANTRALFLWIPHPRSLRRRIGEGGKMRRRRALLRSRTIIRLREVPEGFNARFRPLFLGGCRIKPTTIDNCRFSLRHVSYFRSTKSALLPRVLDYPIDLSSDEVREPKKIEPKHKNHDGAQRSVCGTLMTEETQGTCGIRTRYPAKQRHPMLHPGVVACGDNHQTTPAEMMQFHPAACVHPCEPKMSSLPQTTKRHSPVWVNVWPCAGTGCPVKL